MNESHFTGHISTKIYIKAQDISNIHVNPFNLVMAVFIYTDANSQTYWQSSFSLKTYIHTHIHLHCLFFNSKITKNIIVLIHLYTSVKSIYYDSQFWLFCHHDSGFWRLSHNYDLVSHKFNFLSFLLSISQLWLS